ncbi:MAG: hypothetical protein HOF75_01120 [Flavobacteriaceae bacterium]|jgi:hypothetical protein|nr:hypothetical protein [Flavobacteriaceae bacterium]MBT3920741.1 hypothetical protein [Flavobacteriaceae bacterium]MBT6705750.1 hypothetical protein [Flavobacteriaceae bacterium]|tara:strand:+ start:134 stop:715 length:582 start_codon:yes stop_codon:yes gene_type:complete
MKTMKKFGILLLTVLIFACNTDDIICLFSPIVGTNGSLTICAGDTVTEPELFSSIEGAPALGGVWTPALAGAGTYTYTIAAFEGCSAASVEVVVIEEDPSFVGTWQGTDGTDQDVHFLIDLVLNNDGTGQFCQTDADGEDCQNINWESNFKVFSITLEGQTDTITFFYEFLNCDQVILTHTDTTGEPVTFTRQ